jgi:putative CocE/NonD family hydrolase
MQLLLDVETPMRDGVVLRGDAYLPDGKRPAIVIRSLLGKDRFGHELLRPIQAIRAGYAVLVQDVRGRFRSDGAFTLSMRREAEDTFDTIEWVARQPWCDGRVGMLGASHGGALQLYGAMLHPPSLRAISPAQAPIVEKDEELLGGVSRFANLVGLVAVLGAEWAETEVAAGRMAPAEGAQLRELGLHPAALTARLPALSAYQPFRGFLRSLAPEPGPPLRFDAAQIAVPALLLTGWFDYGCSATLQAFIDLQAQAAAQGRPSPHRLIIGPWVHDHRLSHYAGDLMHSAEAASTYARLCEDQLAFFAEHLGDGPAATLAPVRYYLIGAEGWRTAEHWPPPGVRSERLYLRSDGDARDNRGRLTPEPPPAAERPDLYDYDPADPMPSHGGTAFLPAPPGPLAQQHLEARRDLLCYSGPVLEHAVDLVGPITLSLHASSSAVDTDFVARLVDVFPDGRSILICAGVHRKRRLEAGRAERYEIGLGHTAWRLEPGHRLRVHVTSSHFPDFDRNMNTGRAPGSDRAGVVAHQTVLHDPEHPSALELSVL